MKRDAQSSPDTDLRSSSDVDMEPSSSNGAWTYEELTSYHQRDLDTLYRSYCINNNFKLSEKQFEVVFIILRSMIASKAEFARQFMVGKPKEDVLSARKNYVQCKKRVSRESIGQRKVSGALKKYKKSFGSGEAGRLKYNLKYNKGNS